MPEFPTERRTSLQKSPLGPSRVSTDCPVCLKIAVLAEQTEHGCGFDCPTCGVFEATSNGSDRHARTAA